MYPPLDRVYPVHHRQRRELDLVWARAGASARRHVRRHQVCNCTPPDVDSEPYLRGQRMTQREWPLLRQLHDRIGRRARRHLPPVKAWLITMGVVAGACASPDVGARHHAVTTPQATYMHAGFAAGPAVFTDGSGHVVEERRYEPFGAPIDAQDLATRDLNALNKRTEAATGWSDHGARWLAPETGRWLSADPPVAAPSADFMAAPWRLHPYQYVTQNPICYWDPDGNNETAIGFGAAAVLDLTAHVASRVSRVPAIGTAGAAVVGAVGLTVAVMAYNRQHYTRPLIGPLEDAFSSDRLEDWAEAQYEAADQERRAYLHLQTTIAMLNDHAATAAKREITKVRDLTGTGDPTIPSTAKGGGNNYFMRLVVHSWGNKTSYPIDGDGDPVSVAAVQLGIGWMLHETGAIGNPGMDEAHTRVVRRLHDYKRAGGTPGTGRIINEPTDDGKGAIEVYNEAGWNLRN
jgi:RHS repeat-associated protein